jgi:hypothetical protein
MITSYINARFGYPRSPSVFSIDGLKAKTNINILDNSSIMAGIVNECKKWGNANAFSKKSIVDGC